MTTLIVCTCCDWYRQRTPVNPPDLDADFNQARHKANALKHCPHCNDVNLSVEQRDVFGRTTRGDSGAMSV